MIVVTKSESTKFNQEESLYLSMTKFDSEHLAKIKSLPKDKRQYVEEKNKSWETPLYLIKDIIALFKPEEIKIAEDIDLEYEQTEESNIGIEIFEKELQYIKNDKIREFTIEVLKVVPNYFWHIGSSSTQKYHPQYALGEGGLARHVKASVIIANSLFDMECKFTDLEKDIILSALFLHDSAKLGIPETRFTVFDHPLVITNFIRENNQLYSMIEKEIIEEILSGIESHMGRFNTDKRSKIILPVPKTEIQKFIHIADYLASRKFLEVKFN